MPPPNEPDAYIVKLTTRKAPYQISNHFTCDTTYEKCYGNSKITQGVGQFLIDIY